MGPPGCAYSLLSTQGTTLLAGLWIHMLTWDQPWVDHTNASNLHAVHHSGPIELFSISERLK